MNLFFIPVSILIFGFNGVNSGRICGVPPICKCHVIVGILECTDIEKFPKLPTIMSRRMSEIIMTGNITEFPEDLVDRKDYTIVKRIDVKATLIPCEVTEPLKEYFTSLDIILIDECIESVTSVASSTVSPMFSASETIGTTNSTAASTETTDTTTSVATETSGNGSQPWPLELVSSPTPTYKPKDIATTPAHSLMPSGGKRNWFETNLVWTVFNFATLFLLLLFIYVKCCQCSWRKAPCTPVGARRRKESKAKRRAKRVETLGQSLGLASSTDSMETVELFSVPPDEPRGTTVTRRRSVEKEL